jgi:Mg-chelatase subunit ChlD
VTVLSVADQQAVRAGAIRSVLEKTDRILGMDTLRVKVEEGQAPAPAYTDGETIFIASGWDPVRQALKEGFTPSTMMITTALNYHELAHCMFMPRLDTTLVKRVRDEGLFMSFNILQDQTDETRFVKLYEPSRHYFTSLVTNYMMKNEQYLRANYVLVAGRLFLPQRFRDAFRSSYVRPKLLDDIDALVAEYKSLVYPRDSQRMLDVIREFHDLINDTPPSGALGTPHDKVLKGKDQTEKAKELAGEEEFVSTESEEEPEPSEDDDADDGEGSPVAEKSDEGEDGEEEGSAQGDEGEDGEEEGSAQGDEEGEDEGDDDQPGDADGDGTGGSDKPQNSSEPPPGGEAHDPLTPEELKSLLEETFDDLVEDLTEELEDRIDAVKSEEQNYEVQASPDQHSTIASEPIHRLTVDRCIEEFRRVEQDLAPGWHRSQRSGKLDPRKYARALRGDEQVFKRWREGVHDALDFEVVFCLDQSGSMSGRIKVASISLWVLKRTFEECDGIVTTLGFHAALELLQQRNKPSRADKIPVFMSKGSTYVGDALGEAKRILGVSTKPLKFCVVISDGGFFDTDIAAEHIRTMGCPVVMIGIEQDVSYWTGKKNVVHTQTITDPAELVEVIKSVALRLSDERLSKRGMA